MKKVFLSLITVFMVLSLSVVLVKASEATTVELVDGVQIRTDGNNGLRWQASVSNAAENQTYGFLFAQGDLAEVTVETANVVNEQVDGLNEDGTFAATMVKFPKAAATQDISVVAYVYDGENYTYSNVVVRNLSEVAVEAYKNGVEGDFVKAVYDASETTFNLNGGEIVADYEFKVTRYDVGSNTGQYIGMSPSSHPSGATGKFWYRICFKYVEELDLYKVVAVRTSGDDLGTIDYDYIMGAFENSATCTDKEAHKVFRNIIALGDEALNYYAQFEVPTTSTCDVQVKLFKDYGLFNNKEHYGGGTVLPKVQKEYYDFAGWYNNEELAGKAITVQGKDRELFAKYTPTNYTISYNLNGGVCSTTLVENYNIESATVVLPTESAMTIEGGKFGGWYDNLAMTGEPVTEINTGSHENIELYALWIMDAPTVLELTAADSAVLEQVAPTIIVSPEVKAGKYIANEVEYAAGSSAFATIADALSAAGENNIIYVFAGTYSDDLSINTKGISIYGPNYNIDANGTRNTEAIISGITTIGANDTSLNGVKYTGAAYITLNASTNVSLLNIYSDATGYGYIKETGNRKGFIYSAATVKNLVIKNSYFTIGDSVYIKDVLTSYGTINGMTLEGNTFTHSYAGSTTTEMITATNIAGVITINDNYIEFPNGNFSIMLGAYSNACTKINVTNNTFGGGKYVVAGLYIRKAPATCVVNIIGNTMVSMTGNCMDFNGSVAGAIYNIKYNYFDVNTSYKITNKGSATIVYENNFYAAAQTTSTSDYGIITSKAALDAAYAEYLANLK